MGLASIAALTGLMLNPFNAVPDFLQSGKPWYAFDDQGPVLQLVRVQKLPVKSCKAWTDALTAGPDEGMVPVQITDGAQSLQRNWEPWTEKDIEPIQDCDDFPCKVKLDSAEVESMKMTRKDGRVMKFLSLVLDRVNRYVKTMERKPYETPGIPIDPWKLFEERGFKSSAARPTTPMLFARKLNFAPDKMLTMHQILDRRVAKVEPLASKPAAKPKGKNEKPASSAVAPPANYEAVVWVRDVYTDHYFDSWGEWNSVHCEASRDDASNGEVIIIQSLLSEMDLLKSKNIFAHAAFGRYRSAFEDNGKIYLNAQFERLKKTAEKESR